MDIGRRVTRPLAVLAVAACGTTLVLARDLDDVARPARGLAHQKRREIDADLPQPGQVRVVVHIGPALALRLREQPAVLLST